MFGEYLSGKECTVYNVDGDTDVLIVQTAIRLSEEMMEDSYVTNMQKANIMYLNMWL